MMNKIALPMLESKVLVGATLIDNSIQFTWSDGSTFVYTPPTGQTVDLSNYFTRIESENLFLTKAQTDTLYAPIGTVVAPANVDSWNLVSGGLTWTAGSLTGWWSGNLYNNWGNGVYRIDGNMIPVNGGILAAEEMSLIVFVGSGGTSHNSGLMPQLQTVASADMQTTEYISTKMYFTSGYVQIGGVNSSNTLRIYKLK